MIALQLSIEVAFIALIINAIFGLSLNYVMKHYAFPGKSLIDSFFTLPLVLPPVVLGFVLLIIFSPGNAFGAWLELAPWEPPSFACSGRFPCHWRGKESSAVPFCVLRVDLVNSGLLF